MGLYRTEAIVVRSRKYSEADSILTLITHKKGKVSAIAKGVKKQNSRLRGGVQLFTYNDMLLYEGRNLDIVTQSQCLEAFTALQYDARTMTAACYWCELLDSFIPEREKDVELFVLALAGFHFLVFEHDEIAVRALEIKLLSRLGYMPYMDRCISCGQSLQVEKKISFSARMGGVLCAKCSDGEKLSFSFEVLRIWQQLEDMNLSKMNRLRISSEGLQLLDKALERFLLIQLGYPLKSRPLLKEMWQVMKD
ncbi:MAG: DNA repair protein RecO [Clostridia bacterium]|nr:DNA repair protein RecO [Clostridia bacterium]MDD4047649.1 DNA repair protein RecO [Clostridia bacterium]